MFPVNIHTIFMQRFLFKNSGKILKTLKTQKSHKNEKCKITFFTSMVLKANAVNCETSVFPIINLSNK